MFGFFKKNSPTHFAQPYKIGHDKQFHLLEARRGRGKSYSMAVWALKAALQGIGTIANFHIDLYWMAVELVKEKKFTYFEQALTWCQSNIHYVTKWDEILTAFNVLILIDEVNRLFDSLDRGKEAVPKVVFEWLQQSRRNDITLVFAAQSLDWLSVRVRQLFDFLWRAKKEVDRKTKGIARFWLYGSDPWGKGLSAEIQRAADFKVSIPFKLSLCKLYNTKERIQAIEPVSSFSSFFHVYQYQLRAGIVSAPWSAPKRRTDCNACIRLLVAACRSEAQAAGTPRTAPTSGLGRCVPQLPAILTNERAPTLIEGWRLSIGIRPPLPLNRITPKGT